jgi:conjugal transfer pilus assembly protein TraF
MRALSDNYGLEVLAVSMDGGPNEVFSNYVVDSGQYQRMGLQGGTVPAIVTSTVMRPRAKTSPAVST